MSKNELYLEKDKTYFSYIRWDIINQVPEGNHRILDVGCGAGATLLKLKELGKASEIFGIEINEDIAGKLSPLLNGIIIGDIESIKLPFNEKYFDYILFGDILEHLINPDKILNQYKELLKDDGFIIATIPNIKHFNILLRLIILDEFKYVDEGILDKSHLRFFTKKEIENLFMRNKFKIVEINPIIYGRIKILKNLFRNKILPGGSFFALQYLIKARKKL